MNHLAVPNTNCVHERQSLHAGQAAADLAPLNRLSKSDNQ